jgi:hypothetical protein
MRPEFGTNIESQCPRRTLPFAVDRRENEAVYGKTRPVT